MGNNGKSVISSQFSVISSQLSVISYRRTRRSRNGWHLKKDEKLRKASQARNIINANLANYTNCLVLSGRVGRMKLLGKVGKPGIFGKCRTCRRAWCIVVGAPSVESAVVGV